MTGTAQRRAEWVTQQWIDGEGNLTKLVLAALQQTRREALEEAAKVCRDWHKIDRTNIRNVMEMAEYLADALDRLREGVEGI